jgi:hypothetical protein
VLKRGVYTIIFSVCFLLFFLEGKLLNNALSFIETLVLSLKQAVQTPFVTPPHWQQYLLLMIKGTGRVSRTYNQA